MLQHALKVGLLVASYLGLRFHLVCGAVFQTLQRRKHLFEALRIVINKNATARIPAERFLPATRKKCFKA
jgi:hypothetical protein